MKVTVVKGPHTDENIQKAYRYILEVYKKEMKKQVK
jgi:hypothetical protein